MTEVLELQVKEVIFETSRTITLVLEPANGQQIVYSAGQFLTILITVSNRSLRRSYSFSSTPGVDPLPAITIKEVVNGEVSRLLIKSIQPKSNVHALQPAGLFTLVTHSEWKRDLFFIAAGSGITPIFSLIKKALHFEPHSRCILIYQNNTVEDTIFHRQLQELAIQFPQSFTLLTYFSQGALNVPAQRLNRESLESLVLALRVHHVPDSRLFICGPKSFMRMAEFTLKTIGYHSNQIRVENFVVDQIPQPSFQIDSGPRTIAVITNQGGYSFPVVYPQNVLQAALAHSVNLPYSCRGGRCSSCVAKCLKGKMHMSINEVLTEQELQAGYVLPCVGYAETDLVLEYG